MRLWPRRSAIPAPANQGRGRRLADVDRMRLRLRLRLRLQLQACVRSMASRPCPSLHALGAPVSGRLQSKWWWWWWSRTRPNARKVWGLVITHLRYVQSRRGACPSRLHNKGQQHRPRTDFWTVFAACWRMKCLLLNAPNAGEMCRSPKTHHYTAPHTTRPAA